MHRRVEFVHTKLFGNASRDGARKNKDAQHTFRRTTTEEELQRLAVEQLSGLLIEWAGAMDIANNLSVQLTAVWP